MKKALQKRAQKAKPEKHKADLRGAKIAALELANEKKKGQKKVDL